VAESFKLRRPAVIGSAGDKRRYDDIGMTHGNAANINNNMHNASDHDIWSEFQSMMMSVGGNRGHGVESFFQGPSNPSSSSGGGGGNNMQ
jgi:hypothetical protein